MESEINKFKCKLIKTHYHYKCTSIFINLICKYRNLRSNFFNNVMKVIDPEGKLIIKFETNGNCSSSFEYCITLKDKNFILSSLSTHYGYEKINFDKYINLDNMYYPNNSNWKTII
jgi:hypothetical protein